MAKVVGELVLVLVTVPETRGCDGCIYEDETCGTIRHVLSRHGLQGCHEGYIYVLKGKNTKEIKP